MLNELLIVERGARQAGVMMKSHHPDIKDARRTPTLLVKLSIDGHVMLTTPLASSIRVWTLRDGQHNSFPFVQLKWPLWDVPKDDERRRQAVEKKDPHRRAAILALGAEIESSVHSEHGWPGDALLDRLRERRVELVSLQPTDAAVVLATIDRFLVACDRTAGGEPNGLLSEISASLVDGVRESPAHEWINVANALLLEGSGALLFDAANRAGNSVLDRKWIDDVSEALGRVRSANGTGQDTACALTGEAGPVVQGGSFPQPNLPLLGQTFLFARNKDIPASGRYGRFAADTMPVGVSMADRLAAAINALTSSDREGVSWRSIPGEKPKQNDLLLAFVDSAPEEAVVEILAGEDDRGAVHELQAEVQSAESVAFFEKRTKRLIDAVTAKVGADFRQTRARIAVAVFRKVDPANRKIVFQDTPTVDQLYRAARDWASGERNIPSWIALPVLRKGETKPRPMSPPHVAPLGLIGFTRELFIRNGTERQQVTGMPAGEALGLFFDAVQQGPNAARRRAERLLRLTLIRRSALVSGAAHAMRRGFESLKDFDRREVLRTVTVLGVLLQKLELRETDYMTDMDVAFRLGQLLAAADVVHVGYCADVRDGSIPPSLLGNQVFSMAQSTPEKALAILCRRWKPYAGWVMRTERERERVNHLVDSGNKCDQQRGWDIRKALRNARDVQRLAESLASSLHTFKPDEVFRAKLLLGYMAGLPPTPRKEESDHNDQTTRGED